MNQKANNEKLNDLIDKLAMWPEWKLNASMLDETDLKVKELVMARKNMYRKMLTNYLNGRLDYKSIQLEVLPKENNKKMIKVK